MKAQEIMALKAAATVLHRYTISDVAERLDNVVHNEHAKRNFAGGNGSTERDR